MFDTLSGLNKEQKQAVATTEGYIRVVAGPGTGKTNVISRRYAYLVKDAGIASDHILCVTFTNKAANEMRQRIHRMINDSCGKYISTFHGFCTSFLREESHIIFYPSNFLVLDSQDSKSILSTIYQEQGLTLRDITYSQALELIGKYKTSQKIDYYNYFIKFSIEELHSLYLNAVTIEDIIFYGYLYHQRKIFSFDYNDLIIITLYILNNNQSVCAKWQRKLEYIMVDEFQDIDTHQYQLMCILSAYHKNLFVVGDPDQTIYSWRGAKIDYILNFDVDFPNVKNIRIETNYRSTAQILDVANSLISKNSRRIDKKAISANGNGNVVVYNHLRSNWREADWIVSQIEYLRSSGVEYHDIAILYRAHYISGVIEKVLLEQQIPYKIYSGVQFYEREEIKDAHSYLRAILFQDDLSILRIINKPRRNIGKNKIKLLTEYATKRDCSIYEALIDNLDTTAFRNTDAKQFVEIVEEYKTKFEQYSISELLSLLLDVSGYEQMRRTEGDLERLDNLSALKQMIYDFENGTGESVSLLDYISHIALLTNTDLQKTNNHVQLMTIHASKGLEFPFVFLCGMNEGIFPSKHIHNLDELEEERRLAFVAITRAEKALFISDAEGVNIDQSFRFPSRFIFDIQTDSLLYESELDNELLTQSLMYIESKNSELLGKPKLVLQTGDQIAHAIFGHGTIVDVNITEQVYTIQFDRSTTIRTISFNAPIESCP